MKYNFENALSFGLMINYQTLYSSRLIVVSLTQPSLGSSRNASLLVS